MKTRIHNLLMLALALALAPAVSVLMPVGCASSTSSYKTLAIVGESVDASMHIYFDAVKTGQVSIDDQRKVMDLHNRYQPIFSKAVVAAQMDISKLAPQEVADIAAEITALIFKLTHKSP